MRREFCSLFLKNFCILTNYYSNNVDIFLFRYDGLQSFRNTLRKLALLLYLLKISKRVLLIWMVFGISIIIFLTEKVELFDM